MHSVLRWVSVAPFTPPPPLSLSLSLSLSLFSLSLSLSLSPSLSLSLPLSLSHTHTSLSLSHSVSLSRPASCRTSLSKTLFPPLPLSPYHALFPLFPLSLSLTHSFFKTSLSESDLSLSVHNTNICDTCKLFPLTVNLFLRQPSVCVYVIPAIILTIILFIFTPCCPVRIIYISLFSVES